MMSEENQNEIHWTLMGIDPDLFEMTKNMIDDPNRSSKMSKQERLMIEMMKQYVRERQMVSGQGSPSGSPKNVEVPQNSSKTIINMQDDIKWMKISLEKMVPAEQDIKALGDRMTFEFETVPHLPTYVKVPLTENPIPCILNVRTIFNSFQDSIGANNIFYLSGSSKRPSENNN